MTTNRIANLMINLILMIFARRNFFVKHFWKEASSSRWIFNLFGRFAKVFYSLKFCECELNLKWKLPTWLNAIESTVELWEDWKFRIHDSIQVAVNSVKCQRFRASFLTANEWIQNVTETPMQTFKKLIVVHRINSRRHVQNRKTEVRDFLCFYSTKTEHKKHLKFVYFDEINWFRTRDLFIWQQTMRKNRHRQAKIKN